MKEDLKKEIEKIFRNSNSSDELFDTFRVSIDKKIKDVELYKTLLSNKTLNSDEITMYAEKICKEFPDLSYKVFFWVGSLLSAISFYGKHHDAAFQYYKKAAKVNKASHEPYLAISKMYIRELNTPKLERITETLEKGIESVITKSKICFALSKLYKKIGDIEKEKKFQKLGEKYQKDGY